VKVRDGKAGCPAFRLVFLDFGRLDLVLLKLLIKGTSGDSETLGGFLHSASLFLKHSFDVLFFEFQKGET
jgi:hypothetical protein